MSLFTYLNTYIEYLLVFYSYLILTRQYKDAFHATDRMSYICSTVYIFIICLYFFRTTHTTLNSSRITKIKLNFVLGENRLVEVSGWQYWITTSLSLAGMRIENHKRKPLIWLTINPAWNQLVQNYGETIHPMLMVTKLKKIFREIY